MYIYIYIHIILLLSSIYIYIRHRAGACEGTRAFLRCWPCTGPNLRSFYYTYRGAPPRS